MQVAIKPTATMPTTQYQLRRIALCYGLPARARIVKIGAGAAWPFEQIQLPVGFQPSNAAVFCRCCSAHEVSQLPMYALM